MDSHGIDLFCEIGVNQWGQLHPGTTITLMGGRSFDEIMPRTIMEALATADLEALKRSALDLFSLGFNTRQTGLLLAFRTRDGAEGALEYDSPTARPRGVKIRYKLAQAAAPTRRLEDMTKADRDRAVALFNDIEDFGHEFDAVFTARNHVAAQTSVRRLSNLLTNFNAVVRGTDCEFPSELFDSVTRLRQAVDTGNWAAIGEAARRNETIAREFQRIGRQMAELARHSGAADATSFGPEMRQVLSQNDSPDNPTDVGFIDLDRNLTFKRKRGDLSLEETESWVKSLGIDAVAVTIKGAEVQGLAGWDMRLLQVEPDIWESPTPAALQPLIERVEFVEHPECVMRADRALPATFLFKTREGRLGLLQITGFPDNPRRVEFRYKLVRSRNQHPYSDAVDRDTGLLIAPPPQPAPDAPPVVIQTSPQSGRADVDPTLTELRVSFSKPMRKDSWAWCKADDDSFPEVAGQPRYLDDGRTCLLPVKLQPGRVYATWINSNKIQDFRDVAGQPAMPYLLIFKTKE